MLHAEPAEELVEEPEEEPEEQPAPVPEPEEQPAPVAEPEEEPAEETAEELAPESAEDLDEDPADELADGPEEEVAPVPEPEEEEPVEEPAKDDFMTGSVLTGFRVIDVRTHATTPLDGSNPTIRKSDFRRGFSIIADVSNPADIESVTFSAGSTPFYTHTEYNYVYDMFRHRSWSNPPTGVCPEPCS